MTGARLDVVDLRVAYGDLHALFGVDPVGRTGHRRAVLGANGPASSRSPRRWAWSLRAGAGTIPSTARTSRPGRLIDGPAPASPTFPRASISVTSACTTTCGPCCAAPCRPPSGRSPWSEPSKPSRCCVSDAVRRPGPSREASSRCWPSPVLCRPTPRPGGRRDVHRARPPDGRAGLHRHSHRPRPRAFRSCSSSSTWNEPWTSLTPRSCFATVKSPGRGPPPTAVPRSATATWAPRPPRRPTYLELRRLGRLSGPSGFRTRGQGQGRAPPGRRSTAHGHREAKSVVDRFAVSCGARPCPRWRSRRASCP